MVGWWRLAYGVGDEAGHDLLALEQDVPLHRVHLFHLLRHAPHVFGGLVLLRSGHHRHPNMRISRRVCVRVRCVRCVRCVCVCACGACLFDRELGEEVGDHFLLDLSETLALHRFVEVCCVVVMVGGKR